VNRRDFLRAATATTATLLVPALAKAQMSDFWTRNRVLWLRLAGKNEEFRVEYWVNGVVDVANYTRLCYILRDWHEQEVRPMDINLLNLLYGIQYWSDLELGSNHPLIIESGYRTDITNSRLETADKNSMHKQMRAADIRHPICSPKAIGQKAQFFQMGGVGFYSTITHVDTGRVRTFQGKSSTYKIPK
jgi:uncharacterized protein YcbK (DUF882 family)